MFLLAVVLVAGLAAADHPDNNINYSGFPYYDKHHREDSYCCYKVKRELEEKISTFEHSVLGSFSDLRKGVKRNLDKLEEVEEELDEREDFDFTALQSEVNSVHRVVEGVKGDVHRLKESEHRHHEGVLALIALLDHRVRKDEKEFEEKLKHVEKETGDVAITVVGVKEELGLVHAELKTAKEQRHHLHEDVDHVMEQIRLDEEKGEETVKKIHERFNHVHEKLESLSQNEAKAETRIDRLVERGREFDVRLKEHGYAIREEHRQLVNLTEESTARFEELETTVHNVSFGLEFAVGKLIALEYETDTEIKPALKKATSATDDNALKVRALNATVSSVAGMSRDNAAKLRVVERVLNATSGNVKENAVNIAALRTNVTSEIGNVDARLNASVAQVTHALEMYGQRLGHDETSIMENRQNLTTLKESVERAESGVIANAAAIAALRESVTQLRQELGQHQDSIVNELKRLTAAVGA